MYLLVLAKSHLDKLKHSKISNFSISFSLSPSFLYIQRNFKFVYSTFDINIYFNVHILIVISLLDFDFVGFV